MIDLSRSEQAMHAELCACAEAVSQFRGSEATICMLRLVDAMTAVYAVDLMRCSAEDLKARQSLVMQLMALKEVLIGTEGASPRI